MIEQAYQKSLELLSNNSSRAGFLAAGVSRSAQNRRYLEIFGRDAIICSLGALAAGEEELIRTAKRSLISLANNISASGQMPFAVDGKRRIARFWLPQSVDGNIWWLIMYWLYSRLAPDQSFDRQYKEIFYQSLGWLENRMSHGLIEQGEAADWADEMPRSGLVLYTNSLWLIFLNLIKSRERYQVYRNFLYFFSREKVKKSDYPELEALYSNYRSNLSRRVKSKPYFLTAVSRVTVEDSFDVFGNILASLSGLLSSKKVNSIIDSVFKEKANQPFPVRVLAHPIVKDKQGAFESSHQNRPWHYHNAGAWPMAGGFWVYLLVKQGKILLARQELEKLAYANYQGKWGFYEFFQGKTGKPMGVRHQSWNAAVYIMAYQAVVNKKLII